MILNKTNGTKILDNFIHITHVAFEQLKFAEQYDGKYNLFIISIIIVNLKLDT